MKITKAARIVKDSCNMKAFFFSKRKKKNAAPTYVFVAALQSFLLEDKRLRFIRERIVQSKIGFKFQMS